MAFDGTTIAAVRKELSDSILGGRIYKIAQPEPDELLITIKTPEGQRKLYISCLLYTSIKLTNCHLIFEQLYNSKVNISIFFDNSKHYKIKELY